MHERATIHSGEFEELQTHQTIDDIIHAKVSSLVDKRQTSGEERPRDGYEWYRSAVGLALGYLVETCQLIMMLDREAMRLFFEEK